jgi:hypothetical protein
MGRGGADKNSVFSGNFKGLPETINEDIKEHETPLYERQSRFQEMRDHNEFGHGPKRYKSDDRRKGRRRHGWRGRVSTNILNLPSTYVSETDEENSSSSNEIKKYNNNRKRKTKVISLAHYS